MNATKTKLLAEPTRKETAMPRGQPPRTSPTWRLGGSALALLILAAAGCSQPAAQIAKDSHDAPLAYPQPRRGAELDTYHGVRVPDPYRWMEEDSPELDTWLAEQEEVLQGYVHDHPLQARLEERIEHIRNFERHGLPIRGGERLFFTDNAPDRKHPELFARAGNGGPSTRVFDFAPVLAGSDHGVNGIAPSPDGRHVAWVHLSPAGWGSIEVIGADGKLTGDRLDGAAGASMVWSSDGRGFFYTSYGQLADLESRAATPQVRLSYHRLGKPQSADVLLFSDPDDPAVLIAHQLGQDGRYLVLSKFAGTRRSNTVAYLDLERGLESGWIPLIDEADAGYTFEGNVGRTFLFQTTLDAPRGRLIAIDLDQPARQSWREVIPERESSLSTVSQIGDRLVVTSTLDARPAVEIFRPDGTLETTVELPSLGLLNGFRDDPASRLTFFQINSLKDPGTTYSLDLKRGETALYRRPELAFDPEELVLAQHFYQSGDGTRVPIYVAHRRGLELDGSHPVFMYGYGHGGWTAFPWFQPHLIAWLELGGVYALPGLRGGGEYGAEWRDAGTRRNKQNTIDDFLAAAEWLIAEGYTSAPKLVANGGSASGILAAAAVIQRPDLFGAALVEFPFLDMFRYHHFTAIPGWTGGYGTVEDPEDFAVLRRYSPLHTLEPGTCYPPILTVVAGEDTATAPMHGYKMTAALQSQRPCANPYLLKLIPEVGHYSYGADPDLQMHNQAEIVTFLAKALDLDWS